jgi:hypothetical protein
MKINEVTSDPILDFISRAEQQYSLSYGNCGVLAIALNEKFNMDQFLFVENDAEPDRLYHVAATKNGKIYDADGITNMTNVRSRGIDDDYLDSEPEVKKFPASQDFYRFILNGTDPDITVEQLVSIK